MAIVDRHGGARRVVPWLERLDPLTVLCAVAAFVIFLPHGFDGALTLDLGIYGYGGQQVAEGVLPYVGVVNRVGPLADLLAGAGAFVSGGLGIDEVLGMRLVFMMLSITCIVLVYVLARELFSCRLFGLVAAAALLSFQGFIDYATYGPREKTAMVMFVLASLLSMTYQRWLTTGVLISLATLVWQPALFALIAGARVVILLGTRRQDWLPAMVRVLVGGAIPMAVVVGTYAAAGELSAFLDCFIVINAFYTHQPSFLTDVPAAWGTLVSGYGASLWILLIGLTGLILLALRTLRSHDRPTPPQSAALIGTAAFALVATAWTLFAYNNWPDAFVVLPAGAIGVACLVSTLSPPMVCTHRNVDRDGRDDHRHARRRAPLRWRTRRDSEPAARVRGDGSADPPRRDDSVGERTAAIGSYRPTKRVSTAVLERRHHRLCR